ncbi:hypothetical protein MalM25_00680 [Planctomycetes bacterium MalM25]|nr:hypothetical protein MalM25_00680 [Planctomycetes bacterium MalM25]
MSRLRPLTLLALLLWPVGACALEASIEGSESLSAEDALADLVKVWECRFLDDRFDINYDRWPDRWQRTYDDEHPQYVRMEIREVDDPSVPGRCLTIEPDGASARATSPPIFVKPKFSYKLRMRVRVKGAVHGEARVRVAFHAHDKIRQLQHSPPLPTDGEWREIEIGDYQPRDPDVERMYVHLDYDAGEHGDLHAEVAIADMRLYRLPSIKIHTGSRYNVYTDPKDVKVTCSLSGILKQNPEIRFQLLDATNKSIGSGGQLELPGKIISESRTRASDIVDGFDTDKTSYEGEIDWLPPINEYGFYRVRVGMFNPETNQPIGDARSITIAVVRQDLEISEQGEFGWSLPHADRPLSFDVLQELLPRVGVKRVKLPVWFQPGDERRSERIVQFAEQLAARGIETVGVLEDPALWINSPLATGTPPPIEGLLSADPSYWTPLIDHVITRLSLRIRWWQLGRDGDTSFVGYDRLIPRLTAIRNQMFRFGQDIRMGIGWRWDHAQAWDEPLGWDFEQMAGREHLDATGLNQALTTVPPSPVQRWVLVAPPEVPLELPTGINPNDTGNPLVREAFVVRHQRRVRDFVKQILVAKMHGTDGIFIADPFSGSADAHSGQTGVMNQDGTPGELLLPWRTCARLLGGADYIGTIQLPNKSQNWLFRRPDGKVVMVLWNLSAPVEDANAAPIEEVLYLGENVHTIDVWGSTEEPEMRGERQVIKVGRMPRFVFGLNESIARWRMATRFESGSVPSVFGVEHQNAALLTNTFRQGIGGRVKVFVPARGEADEALSEVQSAEWEIGLNNEQLTLKAGEEIRAPVSIRLQDAQYGDQLVRLDFSLLADREYRFSVWRQVHVGLEAVKLEVQTRLGHDGRLIVEQQMSQESGQPSDFTCYLYVPGTDKRRKRAQVFRLGPDVDKKHYTYLNPKGLIGLEMRLKIEEVDGRRELIHRFKVDPKPYESAILDDEEAPLRGDSA